MNNKVRKIISTPLDYFNLLLNQLKFWCCITSLKWIYFQSLMVVQAYVSYLHNLSPKSITYSISVVPSSDIFWLHMQYNIIRTLFYHGSKHCCEKKWGAKEGYNFKLRCPLFVFHFTIFCCFEYVVNFIWFILYSYTH